VDREWLTLGAKARWRPFYDACDLRRGMSVTGGYEWSEINRSNVTYHLEELTPAGEFTQPTTVTNTWFVGLSQEWNARLDTYVRYRMIANSWPIVGITQRSQVSVDAAANSNQPEHEDRIEIGGNWHPTNNLLLSASFWIQNAYNRSEVANFDEDSYPIILSGWYAPNERWSFTGGYATFSNWIVQDITLGRENGGGNEFPAFTAPWRYAGRADVLNGGVNFAWTCRTTLVGGVEYVRSRNVITDVPSSPEALAAGNPYTDMPSYSQVRVNTWRLTAGVDYELSQYMNTFVRYNFLDYDDRAMPYNAGQAHMVMGGLSGVF